MNLILAAKAHALLKGRNHVGPDDITAVAPPILRHRLILNFGAQSDGVTVDRVIAQLIKAARGGGSGAGSGATGKAVTLRRG